MDILLLALRLLLAIALYTFLGAVLLMLWHDLRQTVASRETGRSRGRLVVVHSEDEALAVGATFPLQLVTSLGRSPDNTIVVPDTFASAHHTLLTWREAQWWLEDQNSRNGTRLNGALIHAPTLVSAGDVIGVGRARLKLELE
jgi:hypothetical protein